VNTTTAELAPFRLAPHLSQRWPTPLANVAARMLERLIGLDRCADTYARVPRGLSAAEFSHAVLGQLGVRVAVEGARDDVPSDGPLLIVANHPSGGIDGLILLAELGRRRPDLRVIGNEWLTWLPELADSVIAVDVLGGAGAAHRNGLAYRAARRHLTAGGALLVFPSGEVASWDVRARAVVEAPWPSTVARLASASSAAVLPAFIAGRNDAWFQAAGLVHPRLRTALLIRALFQPRPAPTRVRLGTLARVERTASAEAQATRLRLRTLALEPLAPLVRGRDAAQRRAAAASDDAVPPTVTATLRSLATTQSLARVGELDVVHVPGGRCDGLVEVIGRLRERAFAAVGEGSGAHSDVDRFDSHYDQLVLWDREAQRVAGGYRLCATNGVDGPRALYTRTLFDYDRAFLSRLQPGVELGRSFISREYQRSHGALFALWRGIAAYVAAHPDTVHLFGAVSISASYRPASIALLTGYLEAHHGTEPDRRPPKPCRPLPRSEDWRTLQREARQLDGLDAVEDVVRSIEPDGRGMPVLLRQYLKLGARTHGFNVDRQFSSSVDVLLSVDLRGVEPRTLAKFMGAEAARSYRERHLGRHG
jgi:putative hemolysin